LPSDIDIPQLIESVRGDAGPRFVQARQEAETDAKAFLDKWAGRMDRDQARELGRLLNRHSWGSSTRNNRFLPGLSNPLIDQMTEDLDHFNQITHDLWRSDIDSGLNRADQIFRNASFLPGAGRSYPTMLLYLREPARFAIWFKRLDRGLVALTSYQGHARTTGLDAYLDYSSKVQELRSAYDLAPEEMDALLSAADDQASVRAADARKEETPTIRRAAFKLLKDLRENNSKEWFEANRNRYEALVRDPVAAVFEAVAAGYIRSLDPLLNTNVRRDEVLARINKYAPGPPYYDYYWGAFSRGKKQDDVQLYMSLHWDHLDFGFFLGSAPDEAIEDLVAGLEGLDDSFVESLNASLPDLTWYSDDEPVEVSTIDDAIAWAQSKVPAIAKVLSPNDPLIESPDLVDDIGSFLTSVYPLAALAWGDEIDVEPRDAEETALPEYTFEQLVADTSLPAEQLEEWVELLSGEKQAALFYGPPGTGKTFVVEKLARFLAGTDGKTSTVQFHPSFSYEDFIEGLRPATDDEGYMTYEIRPGVFRQFCDGARARDARHVFVVDEINRAELGSVLGEVMMLIEYRGKKVPLPYSQEDFSVPKNIVLLATMNTADRSLALVDFALRRRFHAFRMLPNRDVLAAAHGAEGDLALTMFDLVQEYVDNEDFAPGHSYWMVKDVSARGLQRIWSYEIRPYLHEYWFESRSRLDDLEKAILQLLAEGV
jgi:hypothetical protein